MMTSSTSATATARPRVRRLLRAVLGAVLLAASAATVAPVHAHHSFSIFDSAKTKVFTGVVVRVNPDVNHLQIFFAVMNEERTNVLRNAKGEPIIWAVEMAGSAQAARQGISVNAFPPRTIMSVGLHPLRSGEPAGDRGDSPLFKCPANTPPKAGKHCDSVEGHVAIGTGKLPVATDS